jgi:hypothetical protein
LTDLFQQRVAREVKDGLQAALGDLAKVKVLTKHPKLAEITRFGLARTLDNWRERSPFKTHFVLIDFSGTAYTIQTRQHDGLTGLPSPTVRHGRERDPAYVGRTAALMVERDLGLLGTVESEPDKEKRMVRVQLKGGGLGTDLSQWVKKGEVFALVRVAGAGPGQLVPWAVLQVEEPAKDGACVCHYFSRYVLGRVSGLVCVLIGTQTGPLRLRLMQEKPGGKLGSLDAAVILQIRRTGFDGEDTTRLQLSTNGARDVDTSAMGEKGIFNKLAFVSVLSGDKVRARVPVPLVDDKLIVLPVPAGTEESNLIAFRFRNLQTNVFDSYRVQTDLFNKINELSGTPERRAEALAEVRKTIERCQQDHLRLAAERDEVVKEIASLPDKDQPSKAAITAVDNRLKLIKEGEKDLLKHLTALQEIEKKESDPKRKEWLIQMERAKALVKDGELGQAIAIYEKAPSEYVTAALKTHLAQLKRNWEAKGEPQLKARKFIYTTWPVLTTADMEGRVKEAMDAAGVCESARKFVWAVKLRSTTDKHIQRMLRELEALRPDVNLDDEKPAKRIEGLTKELKALIDKIDAILESGKKE